jgi:ParB family transcriptional regulator, chromosome partitioning protein
MNPKHGLGRGLGALLASSPYPATQEAPGKVQDLPIEDIAPNPNQPRKSFEDSSLRDLSESLRRSGVLQPVVVRRVGEK